MNAILVSIESFSSTDFPGWVKCKLVDSNGAEWLFEEKIPVVSTENISENSAFPCKGYLECEVKNKEAIDESTIYYTVDTSRPSGIQSINGNHIFKIRSEQLVCL